MTKKKKKNGQRNTCCLIALEHSILLLIWRVSVTAVTQGCQTRWNRHPEPPAPSPFYFFPRVNSSTSTTISRTASSSTPSSITEEIRWKCNLIPCGKSSFSCFSEIYTYCRYFILICTAGLQPVEVVFKCSGRGLRRLLWSRAALSAKLGGRRGLLKRDTVRPDYRHHLHHYWHHLLRANADSSAWVWTTRCIIQGANRGPVNQWKGFFYWSHASSPSKHLGLAVKTSWNCDL